jgi:hypothetical protein
VTARIPAFFETMANSTYLTFFSQYKTEGVVGSVSCGSATGAATPGNQSFASARYYGHAMITPHDTSRTLTDAAIAAELNWQLDHADVTAGDPLLDPDGNVLYMVYLPPGYAIRAGSETSCQVSTSGSEMCGLHEWFATDLGPPAYFAVLPDYGATGAPTCCHDYGATATDIATAISSRELSEAITDPGPDGQPAWFVASTAQNAEGTTEVGDLCDWSASPTYAYGGYRIQHEWANTSSSCSGPAFHCATVECGGDCCSPGAACEKGRCTDPCDKCGDRCCGAREICAKGACVPVPAARCACGGTPPACTPCAASKPASCASGCRDCRDACKGKSPASARFACEAACSASIAGCCVESGKQPPRATTCECQ